MNVCCGGDLVDVASVREIVGSLLLRHVCQLVSNAHAITGIVRSSAQPAVDSTDPTRGLSSGRPLTGGATDEGCSTAVDDSQQVRLATAIYPTSSLMNHSCDPSIISRCEHLLNYIMQSWRHCVAVTSLVVSAKLLCVKPNLY